MYRVLVMGGCFCITWAATVQRLGAVTVIENLSATPQMYGFGGLESSVDGMGVGGQTFTPPGSDTVLDSFTYYGKLRTPRPLYFKGYVMEWDGSRAKGPVLFESEQLSLSEYHGTYTPMPVATGGVSLTAGKQYVAFLWVTGPYDTWCNFGGSGVLGEAGTNPWFYNTYPNGEYVTQSRTMSEDFSKVTSTPWGIPTAQSGDIAFTMTFSAPVPEPSAFVLLGMGAAGLLALAWRRRASR